MKNINTKRIYLVIFIEDEYLFSERMGFSDIFNQDGDDVSEYNYAMQDNADAILDLKIGERLSMNFNRDNKDSGGVIKRIV